MRDLWNQIRQLWKEIGIVRQILERINVQWRMPQTKVMTVWIDQGNILSTGQNGIKWADSTITSFPSAYDADTMTSFIDGVGRGVLSVDGVVQAGYVLVLNDMGSGIGNALLGDGFDRCSVLGAVSVQVGASADYVAAYRVG